MAPKFNATVKDGKLIVKDEKTFIQHFQKYEGQDVYVVVDKKKKIRSLPQNSYYWSGVLPTIAEHTGHTAEELHEIVKRLIT